MVGSIIPKSVKCIHSATEIQSVEPARSLDWCEHQPSSAVGTDEAGSRGFDVSLTKEDHLCFWGLGLRVYRGLGFLNVRPSCHEKGIVTLHTSTPGSLIFWDP